MSIDQLITQVAIRTGSSEMEVKLAFDKLINPPTAYVPLQGFYKKQNDAVTRKRIRKKMRMFYKSRRRMRNEYTRLYQAAARYGVYIRR